MGEWDHSKLQARLIVYFSQLSSAEQIHAVPEVSRSDAMMTFRDWLYWSAATPSNLDSGPNFEA